MLEINLKNLNGLIKKSEAWIEKTLREYSAQYNTCEVFKESFNGFYTAKFLAGQFYVVVDEIPRPDFPELRQGKLREFLLMKPVGITYKNVYFVKPEHKDDLRLHFHELVHVAQWSVLGSTNFIRRYIEEILTYGYLSSPLEVMAYELDAHFSNHRSVIDILDYVKEKL